MTPSRRSLLAGFLALPVAQRLGRWEKPKAPPAVGRWAFYSWVSDGVTQKAFLDGVLVSEGPAPKLYWTADTLAALDEPWS